MKTLRNWLWLICFLLMVFVGCSSSAPEDPGRMVLSIASPSTTGTPLEGLEGVVLNVEQIEVIVRTVADDPSTESRIQIPTEQRPINLLGLGENISRLIGIYQIEPGYLTQMRFITSSSEIVFETEGPTDESPSLSLALNVPSGEQTGIKIVPEDEVPIEIIDQQTFFWEIQFDPNEQIIVNKGQGYKMKPVLRARVLEERTFTPTVPNQILVTFNDGTELGEIEALNEEIGAVVVGSFEPLNLYLMEFTGISYDEASAFYSGSELVKEQTPSVICTPFQAAILTPNDTGFNNQWGLNNTGQTGGTQDADIDGPEGWNLETGNLNIVIAVLDTGAQLDHPDLADNIFINAGELPLNTIIDAIPDGIITFDDLNDPANAAVVTDVNGNGFIDGEDLIATVQQGGFADGVDDDTNGFVDDLVGMNFANLAAGGASTNDPSDDSTGIFQSHGTATSGIVGARGDNALDIAGLNWRVRILPIKVCTAGGNCNNLNIRAGIRYAVNMGADVANLSFGATFLNNPAGQTVITNFTNFLNNLAGSQGMLIVVSAGNDPVDCDKGTVDCFMAEVNLANLIGIGATTDQDNLSNFSNFGATTIPLAAPGSNILTLNRFSGTVSMFGTSFAAPQVSGVAGLVLARFPALVGNPAAVITRIENGADSLASINNLIVQGRRLNTLGALQ